MTQEEKQLLLIDLCARLPYKVRIKCDAYPNGAVVKGIVGEQVFHTPYFIGGEIIIDKHTIDTVRPYLRSMSSMTEEEANEWAKASNMKFDMEDGFFDCYDAHLSVDWLNKNMFDFRGLIPMGLALEAPDGMYKTE